MTDMQRLERIAQNIASNLLRNDGEEDIHDRIWYGCQ